MCTAIAQHAHSMRQACTQHAPHTRPHLFFQTKALRGNRCRELLLSLKKREHTNDQNLLSFKVHKKLSFLALARHRCTIQARSAQKPQQLIMLYHLLVVPAAAAAAKPAPDPHINDQVKLSLAFLVFTDMPWRPLTVFCAQWLASHSLQFFPCRSFTAARSLQLIPCSSFFAALDFLTS